MQLTPIAEKFVLHWGEMGSRWGVNRTVGQIHALLYLAEQPIHAEEICETLSIARSNVSTSLKELMDWGLVRVVQFDVLDAFIDKGAIPLGLPAGHDELLVEPCQHLELRGVGLRDHLRRSFDSEIW